MTIVSNIIHSKVCVLAPFICRTARTIFNIYYYVSYCSCFPTLNIRHRIPEHINKNTLCQLIQKLNLPLACIDDTFQLIQGFGDADLCT